VSAVCLLFRSNIWLAVLITAVALHCGLRAALPTALSVRYLVCLRLKELNFLLPSHLSLFTLHILAGLVITVHMLWDKIHPLPSCLHSELGPRLSDSEKLAFSFLQSIATEIGMFLLSLEIRFKPFADVSQWSLHVDSSCSNSSYTLCLRKKLSKLFLSKICQIFTNFDNFWQFDG